MNILVVTDKLYPDEHGGSCTVAYELIKQWQQNNQVDVFTCYPEKEDNNKLFSGKVFRNFNKRHIINSSRRLKGILSAYDYDIILTHSILSWLVLYLADKNKARSSITVFHGPWHKEARFKYEGTHEKLKGCIVPNMMYLLEKLYAKGNNNFIFLSKYMYEELNNIHKISDKNITFIPGGVDLSVYKRTNDKNTAKKMLGLDEDEIVLFSLRRLDKRMGLDRLIDAAKILNNKGRDNIKVVIGGKGPYRNDLEKKAMPIKNDVLFAGYIPDDQVLRYFEAADIFVVPTLSLEGFGLVNLEAIAMGVPVLATPQGGMLELDSKLDNMYLSKENTVESLAHSLEQMIDKKVFAPIVETKIKNFDWMKIAESYISVFQNQS